MNFLDELNEAQRKAVDCLQGPVMVVAGAGSGKTRVLTYRIAHLIQKGINPFNILTLTFTNKAAREMRERVDKLVGHEARNLWMGTFHSMFARILRVESEKLGFPRNFTIYDTQDSKNLIKTIVKELDLDEKTYKPSLVYNRISSAKNSLISATEYAANDTIQLEDRQNGKPRLSEIYAIYNKRCFQSSAMDFDDLLFKTNVLLRDFPEVLYKYQHQFQYLLVDEYQDTNFSQYLIIKQLAALNENICVVGDDAQSIYGFRGANIQNILNFKKDYPDVQVFKLEQNYRSTKTIVNAANSIIALNQDQIQKDVWTENIEGNKIEVMKAHSDNEEGMIVASKIFELRMNFQQQNSDFAILYRTNAQSRAMEEALRKKDIPYRIYGGLSFYQRKEIKDLLSYFRLVINEKDEEALKRVLNYPARGLGKTSEEKLIRAASVNEVSIWDVLRNPVAFGLSINAGTLKKLNEFADMIEGFQVDRNKQNAFDLGSRIASSTGLLKHLYEDRTPEGISRYENIQELLNGLKEFTLSKSDDENFKGSMEEFLQDVALLTDQDKEDDKNDSNKVALMTVHLAKGLEFPNVLIVGLEENLFPSQLSMNSRSDLEEERRLFYVALTRAKERAILTYSLSRFRWGNLTYCEPSRFIEEIDPDYLDQPRVKTNFRQAREDDVEKTYRVDKPSPSGKKMIKVATGPSNEISEDVKEILGQLQQGSKVYHEKFGKGVVELLEGEGFNQKASIVFDGMGKKQLLLRFAKLKLI
ncbi:MAG: 3'-5' exonuclease [Vicingaceae bacterium]